MSSSTGRPDGGGSWDDAEAAVRRDHPHWLEHALSYRRHFARSLVGEVPGSADLVRELHAAGVPQWGLTNWSDELYPHAPAGFDIVALLDGVVVSGTEGVAKPDAAAYELVAGRSGLPLAGLAFVDDREANVEAAPRARHGRHRLHGGRRGARRATGPRPARLGKRLRGPAPRRSCRSRPRCA